MVQQKESSGEVMALVTVANKQGIAIWLFFFTLGIFMIMAMLLERHKTDTHEVGGKPQKKEGRPPTWRDPLNLQLPLRCDSHPNSRNGRAARRMRDQTENQPTDELEQH